MVTSAPEVGSEPEPAAAGPRGSAVGGVRASWWNAVVSLVVAVLAAHAPVVLYLLAGAGLTISDLEPTGVRLVLVGACGPVSLVVQLVMIRWLRGGLGTGVPSISLAVVALVAAAVLWGSLLPAGPGVLPLVSALSLVACAADRPLRRGLFVLAVGVGVCAWLVADDRLLVPVVVFMTLAYPYIVFASAWAWDVVVRLDVARRSEADLAVARERLRFASDLHDIQGHSLQVIALKAELGERLLDARPEDAAVQISEVRSEAADALARTRELARGYRAAGIDAELDNARDVLTVAGFECTTSVEDSPRGGETRAVLGRVLREATTNVLRHAESGPVEIRLDRRARGGAGDRRREWVLEVANSVQGSPGPAGGGLSGLADRAQAIGGRLTADVVETDGGRRFVLTVTVPDQGEPR